jgi:trehalose/maltose hydrolase-like predicted phosphorylase
MPWTSGEISLFIVRHLLGVRFDGDTLVLKPALYAKSPPVKADLRYRKSRLKLEIPGLGAYAFAEVNGQHVEADKNGAIRLPASFDGGTVVFHTVKK